DLAVEVAQVGGGRLRTLPLRLKQVELTVELEASIDLLAHEPERVVRLQAIRPKQPDKKRLEGIPAWLRRQVMKRDEFGLQRFDRHRHGGRRRRDPTIVLVRNLAFQTANDFQQYAICVRHVLLTP